MITDYSRVCAATPLERGIVYHIGVVYYNNKTSIYVNGSADMHGGKQYEDFQQGNPNKLIDKQIREGSERREKLWVNREGREVER